MTEDLQQGQNRIIVMDPDEFVRKLEEKEKEKEAVVRAKLSSMEEELEIDVIDVAISFRGTTMEIYGSLGEVYVVPVTEETLKIVDIINNGKYARVKGIRFKGYRRLRDIISIEEVDKIKLDPERFIIGIFSMVGTSMRVVDKEKRYYISEGTINVDRLAELANKLVGRKVKLMASQIQLRSGGKGDYYVIRGIRLIEPKPEELTQPKEFPEEISA